MASRMNSRDINDSLRAGRELAVAFTNGSVPTPVQVRLAMNGGEYCVGQTRVRIFQWLSTEGEYVHKSGGYLGGGIPGLIAMRTATAIGNSRRKAKAGRAAAPQWRQIDEGDIYLTNQRFAIHGSERWSDIWFSEVRMSEGDSRSITLEIQGWARTMLEIPHADYWFVMFQKLAYDNIYMPPAPDDEVPPPVQPRPQYRTPDPVVTGTASDPVGGGAGSGGPIGHWDSTDIPGKTLDLRSDGSFQLDLPDGPRQTGRALFDGPTLVLQAGPTVSSSFRWSVDGAHLTLVRPNGTSASYVRS